MVQKLIAVYVLGICFLSGCVCSVHPILSDTDLTTDFDLTGTWSPVTTEATQQKRSAIESYTFVATKFADGLESDYDVVWNGKDFHGQIGKIGDEYYLQLRRTELEPEIAPLLHAVPVYAIARLRMADDDTLEIFAIDEVKAPKLLAEAKLPYLRYTPSTPIEYFVLTGSTKSMQAVFEKKSEQIFTKRGLFSRSKKVTTPEVAPEGR